MSDYARHIDAFNTVLDKWEGIVKETGVDDEGLMEFHERGGKRPRNPGHPDLPHEPPATAEYAETVLRDPQPARPDRAGVNCCRF